MTRTIPILRTSERSDFKRCPWLWNESWNKGMTTRRTPTWSWFGTAIHAGLEAWYVPGVKRAKKSALYDGFVASLEDQVRKVYTEGGEIEDDEVVDGKKLGLAMLKGYVEHFGQDKEWEVIHPEQSFQIDVPHPTKPGKTIVVYAGTWDLLIRNRITKEFWIVDHKTRKTFPSNLSFYNINDQAGSYLWVAPEVLREMGIFKKKDSIEGLIFNLLRKHMPDTRPVGPTGEVHNKPLKEHYEAALSPFVDLPTRLPSIAVLQSMADEQGLKVLGEISKVQPAALFHREEFYRSQAERVQQGQRVQSEALWMQAARTGKLPIIKTPTEDCNRCQLFEYCEADEQDYDEGQELANTIMRHRDPYAAHREAMERGGISLTVKEVK